MDTILVVEDEKDIISMIRDFMRIQEIEVVEAHSGEEALRKLDETIKLVILDINLENMSGLETCKRIRESGSVVPILFLTARALQCDKILGLGLGGDDYITKPFDPLELVSRVKAHIRRSGEYFRNAPEPCGKVLKVGRLTILPEQYRAQKDKETLALTAKEFELLLLFARNEGIVLSRERILARIWNSTVYDDNVVTTNIKRLRRKIEDDPEHPTLIKTVRSIGYVFEGEPIPTGDQKHKP